MTLNPFLFDLDDQPVLEFTVLRRDGSVYDLTGASIDLLVQGVGEFVCSIVVAVDGTCSRAVDVGDFPAAGRYRSQLRISGAGVTYHTDIFIIQVSESINTTNVFPVPPAVSPVTGGVVFGNNGQLAQDVSNFFWDDTNNNLRLFGGLVGSGGAKVLTLGQGTAPAAVADSGQFWVADFLGAAGRAGFHFMDETGSLIRFGSAATNFTNIDLVNGGVTLRMTADGGNLIAEFGTLSNHPIAFLVNNDTKAKYDASGNFLQGGAAAGTSAVRNIVVAAGTAPSTSPVDVAHIFAADFATSLGSTAIHIKNETGPAFIPGGTIDSVLGTVGTDADTNEKILHTLDVPANGLSANGENVYLVAEGLLAANGNNKTIKVRLNGVAGTVFIDSGVTTANNAMWFLELRVVKTGATTADVFGSLIVGVAGLGSGAAALTRIGTLVSTTITVSSAWTLDITGQNGTASAGDVTCRSSKLFYHPNH